MIQTIGVVGLGQMGKGISELFLQNGFSVLVFTRDLGKADSYKTFLQKKFNRLVRKQVITKEQQLAYISNLKLTSDLNDFICVDLVIEAVVEDVKVKRDVFKQLDDICPKETIFSSNTSSISITKLASYTKREGNFLGIHFMNPATIIDLIEVVKGFLTDVVNIAKAQELLKRVNKESVVVEDHPGFIVNRLLMPQINEAIYILMEGVASKECIDKTVKLALNHPMGPLALADLIGLDTVLAILEVLHKEIGDDKYRPCPLLKKMVDAKQLGKKVKKGFYSY